VSIERGHDPRQLTFIAFGGSGPVHGCRLAQALKIPKAIMPAAAGVTSALGLLAAEVKFDVARTYVRRLADVDLSYLNAMFFDMEQGAAQVVRESAVTGSVEIHRTADLRYVGQGYELTVTVPDGVLDAGAIQAVQDAFHAAYAQRYGYSSPGEPIEATTWKLSASGAGPTVSLPRFAASGSLSMKGERRCYFPEAGGYTATPIYDRYSLFAGATFDGPCIVEEKESTTVIPPGSCASVDEFGNLQVEFTYA